MAGDRAPFEHRKQLSSAQRRHVGREFGQMLEKEAGGGSPGGPKKSPRRSGLGWEWQREQLDPEGFPLWFSRDDSDSQCPLCARLDTPNRSPGQVL